MSKRKNVKHTEDERYWHPERAMGLARALTKSGHLTRREAEVRVAEGRVAVDGDVVADPRAKVGRQSSITVDGEPLTVLELHYFAFNKPQRVICRATDGYGRRLASEYFPPDIPGLQTAGRLDGRTSGLLLVSNDTAWNNAVAGDPTLEHEFRVQIEGEVPDPELGVIGAGFHLPGFGTFKPRTVRLVEVAKGVTTLQVAVGGGQIRPLRRMFITLRRKIILLRRVRIGEVELSNLASGKLRALTPAQIAALHAPATAPSDP